MYITDPSAWCKIDFADISANPMHNNDFIRMHILADNGYEVTQLVLDDTLQKIPSRAFFSCEHLISVTIPGSVTSIGSDAFDQCINLTSVIMESGVETISSMAFWGCGNLTSIAIPDSITSIGYTAFEYCDNLQDIYYTGSETQWSAISISPGNECLENATIHYGTIEETPILGDITGDGKLSNDDVVLLLWHTLFPDDYPLSCPADFTGDNLVNDYDIIRLMWHILFPEQHPL